MPKTTSETGAANKRLFIGVQFECCGVYSRIYRKPEELFYEGRCPKCLRSLTVQVDPKNGVSSKFLKAR